MRVTEILVHLSAPSAAADDARYRRTAAAYSATTFQRLSSPIEVGHEAGSEAEAEVEEEAHAAPVSGLAPEPASANATTRENELYIDDTQCAALALQSQLLTASLAALPAASFPSSPPSGALASASASAPTQSWSAPAPAPASTSLGRITPSQDLPLPPRSTPSFSPPPSSASQHSITPIVSSPSDASVRQTIETASFDADVESLCAAEGAGRHSGGGNGVTVVLAPAGPVGAGDAEDDEELAKPPAALVRLVEGMPVLRRVLAGVRFARAVEPLERGHWVVPSGAVGGAGRGGGDGAWGEWWAVLRGFVESGQAGWDVSLFLEGGTVRVYSFAGAARHMFLLLFVASKSMIARAHGVRWVDGDGVAVGEYCRESSPKDSSLSA